MANERAARGGGVARPLSNATALVSQSSRVVGAGTGANWFGPGDPLPAVAPPEVSGRIWDFPNTYNYQQTKRPYEAIGPDQLKSLAQSYDLLRIILETRKDQVENLQWTIGMKDAKAAPDDGVIKKITAFFEEPDPEQEQDWSQWLRRLLEDLFVLDAPTLLRRRTNGGDLLGLRVLDGGSINRVLDPWGATPATGTAYVQILKGLGAVHYTRDQIIYRPRNPRPGKAFGFGPVEQVIATIMIGVNREAWQLSFFTDGNLPDALIGTPNEWTPDQIRNFQDWFDARLQGNTGERRGAKFVPGDVSKGYVATKETELFGKAEEWLARVICFAFSISPQPFASQVNRACYSADTETLTENGWKLYPEIEPGERIATFNPETGKIEYHAPIQTFVYPMDEAMVRFKTDSVDVLVTPEHKMWLRGEKAKAYGKVEAKDAPSAIFKFLAAADFDGVEQDTFTLPSVRRLNGRGDPDPQVIAMDDWLAFLGFFLSEGGLSHRPGHHMLTLAQNPGPVADAIETSLARCGLSFSAYPPNPNDPARRWNVYGKQLTAWLMAHTGGRCEDKRVPRQFMGLGKRQLRILFDAMMAGDGSWDQRSNRTSGYYTSTSKRLADDVQEIALKLGYSAAVGVHYAASGNRQTAYRVSICARKEHSLRARGQSRTPASVSVDPYDGGWVYCFEVPNHLFVTRRNGKIGIHGNTAETAKTAATEEGLEPIKKWVKTLVDRVIKTDFGRDDLEFKWTESEDTDPKVQADILVEKVKVGLLTINEARDIDGKDKLKDPEADIPLVMTATGFQPVSVSGQIEQKQQMQKAFPPPPPPTQIHIGPDGKPIPAPPGATAGGAQPPKPGGVASAPPASGGGGAVGAAPPKPGDDAPPKPPKGKKGVTLDLDRPKAKAAITAVRKTVAAALKITGASVAKQVIRALDAKKSADHGDGKTNDDRIAAISAAGAVDVDALVASLDLSSLKTIVDAMDDDLHDLAADTATKALAQVGVTATSDLVNKVNARAVAFARDRSAELVGMKWTADGQLVESTTPGMSILDSTRDALREVISKGLDDNIGTPGIADAIKASFSFSDQRASLIANTEVANANEQAKLIGWRIAQDTGVSFKKAWLTAGDDDVDEECEGNEDDGPIDIDDDFSSGDDAPPQHPNCRCVLIPVEISTSSEGAEDADEE